MKRLGSDITGHRMKKVHYREIVSRLAWLALFLIHVLPCISVSTKLIQNPSLKLFVSFGAIVAIMAFAALKAMDAYSLRLHLTRRKWFTFILVGLFFHGGVVAKQLPDIMVANPTIVLIGCIFCASRKVLQKIVRHVVSSTVQAAKIYFAGVEAFLDLSTVPIYVQVVAPRPPPVR